MTPKTLRKERREKFETIIRESKIGSAAYARYDEYDQDFFDADIEALAELLAIAAESRSEIRGIEAAIFSGRKVTEEDMEEKTIRAACNEFESAIGFGALPWDSTADWTGLRKFVVKLYQSNPQEFREFETWRKGEGKYQGCTNKSIRENPRIFIDTHYPTFKASTAMYKKTDEVRPEYKPFKPEERNYVPRPENIKPIIRKTAE